MSDDALERLRKRNRPTVKSRDTSLISSQDIPTSEYPDKETSGKQKDNLETISIKPGMNEDKGENYSTNQRSRHSDIILKTKQTTLRLEESVSEGLSEFCQEAGFCREVFIEALIQYYQRHEDDLGEVIDEARKKAKLRMEVANQKRAKSMMQKFNPSQ